MTQADEERMSKARMRDLARREHEQRQKLAKIIERQQKRIEQFEQQEQRMRQDSSEQEQYNTWIRAAAGRPNRVATAPAPPGQLCPLHRVAHGRQCAIVPPRKHPAMDKLVAGLLVFGWLLIASLATYAPWPLMLVIWGTWAYVFHWLYRQYREHTAPSVLDKPAPAGLPGIPLLVRLYLLPGVGRIVGPVAAKHARDLYRLRMDQRRHPELTRQVRAKLDAWGTWDAGPQRVIPPVQMVSGTAATAPDWDCEHWGHLTAMGSPTCRVCGEDPDKCP